MNHIRIDDKKIAISRHALLRFIERFFDFDFTNLKLLYLEEKGALSINRIKDADFVDWIDETLDISEFYDKLQENFTLGLNDIVTKKLKSNTREKIAVASDDLIFIVRQKTVTTVIKRKKLDV